ncbi:MAG: hypothetical protein G01um101448_287 [Parcubacteria group bacterium Gr01-1014_48]|nr:MAG: hypothetical protein Greene041614_605 [Parcubacteria group bacterium Greene0416_14]TSC74177.1 MAG: hypothetical protein G01um101448_287 [Parcubacteria group bacterium Gr01-1014_48]TSD00853.1 MAG: hypothetical protein Greene101415_654 [Parcubacteria group bacterium Greene1014_15]TSD07935.1 MAG: hypothetical protein Greene07144_565 [Parcubacteria group bacterium Greene0714_4]
MPLPLPDDGPDEHLNYFDHYDDCHEIDREPSYKETYDWLDGDFYPEYEDEEPRPEILSGVTFNGKPIVRDEFD